MTTRVDRAAVQRERERGAEESRRVLLDHDRSRSARGATSGSNSPSAARPSSQRAARAPCGRTVPPSRGPRRYAHPRCARRARPCAGRPRAAPRSPRRPRRSGRHSGEPTVKYARIMSMTSRAGPLTPAQRPAETLGVAPDAAAQSPVTPDGRSRRRQAGLGLARWPGSAPAAGPCRTPAARPGGRLRSSVAQGVGGRRVDRAAASRAPRRNAGRRRRSPARAAPPAPPAPGRVQGVAPTAAAPGHEVQHVARRRPGRRGTCWAAPRANRRRGRATSCRARRASPPLTPHG